MSKNKSVKSESPAKERLVKHFRGGIVRHHFPNKSMTTMPVTENDPFAFQVTGFPVENQVNFATELGRRGSETLGLGTGPTSTVIINKLVATRRSRHALLTNPYAKRSMDVLVSNIVGAGHTLLSHAPDVNFKKQVEDLWNDWIDNVDVATGMSFGAFEALAFRSMLEGGECFVRFRIRPMSEGLPVPLQLYIYESEQIPIIKNEINGLSRIIAGIEFDDMGHPNFYHMYTNHPGEFLLGMNINLDTVLVPADEIIHLHDVRRPNEVRGLPILSQALIKLSDLDRYMDSELVRKKAVSLIGGFIRQPATGDDDDNPFISTQITDVNLGTDAQPQVHIESLEPGTFPILPPGYEVSFISPTDSDGNYKEFMKQQLMMISASLNLTYEQLTGDMIGVNDRTLRANMLEFKRIATNYQKQIVEHIFCKRVFKKWFDLALISGALKIPSGMSDRDARKVQWISDPWDYMNPNQEIATNNALVRAGLKSRSSIITERGEIPEQIDAQIKADQDREELLGLVYTTNAKAVSNAGVFQPGELLPDRDMQDKGVDNEI